MRRQCRGQPEISDGCSAPKYFLLHRHGLGGHCFSPFREAIPFPCCQDYWKSHEDFLIAHLWIPLMEIEDHASSYREELGIAERRAGFHHTHGDRGAGRRIDYLGHRGGAFWCGSRHGCFLSITNGFRLNAPFASPSDFPPLSVYSLPYGTGSWNRRAAQRRQKHHL